MAFAAVEKTVVAKMIIKVANHHSENDPSPELRASLQSACLNDIELSLRCRYRLLYRRHLIPRDSLPIRKECVDCLHGQSVEQVLPAGRQPLTAARPPRSTLHVLPRQVRGFPRAGCCDCQLAWETLLWQASRPCRQPPTSVGASEWRTFAQEKLQIIRRFCIAVHCIGRIEERRQMNKGRYAVAPDVMIEIRISFSLVP